MFFHYLGVVLDWANDIAELKQLHVHVEVIYICGVILEVKLSNLKRNEYDTDIVIFVVDWFW